MASAVMVMLSIFPLSFLSILSLDIFLAVLFCLLFVFTKVFGGTAQLDFFFEKNDGASVRVTK